MVARLSKGRIIRPWQTMAGIAVKIGEVKSLDIKDARHGLT